MTEWISGSLGSSVVQGKWGHDLGGFMELLFETGKGPSSLAGPVLVRGVGGPTRKLGSSP